MCQGTDIMMEELEANEKEACMMDSAIDTPLSSNLFSGVPNDFLGCRSSRIFRKSYG